MIEGVDKTALGATDANQDTGAVKPCSKRINWRCDRDVVVTWCLLGDGHEGSCKGSAPRLIGHNDFGPDARPMWGK